MSSILADAIRTTAADLGVDPTDLATAMSYETGGTFDDWKAGPTTQYGQHRGLIQWGEPQRKKYGVYKGMPVQDQVAAAGQYLKDAGVRPGMGLLDIYSAINAGRVGRYNASDANNGGAPGTVADKVNNQMAGHRQKAAALLGGDFSPVQHTPYEGSSVNPSPRPDQYSDTPAPLQVPTIEQQVAAQNQSPQQYDHFYQEVGAGFSSNAYAPWLLRRLGEGAIDPEYVGPSEEEWKQVTEQLPEQYHEGLLSAGSSETFQYRLKNYQDDYERQQRLAAGGGTGTVGGLVGALIDPVGLAAGVATGGLGTGYVAGANLATRVAVGALSAGVSNAATEAGAGKVLADPNTDPVMGFVVGSAFGALGSTLARHSSTVSEAEAALGASTSTLLPHLYKGNAPQATDIGGAGGIGAQVNNSLTGEIVSGPWQVRDAQVPKAFGGPVRYDVTGQMTTSKNPIVRMIGSAFFDETVGYKDYSVVQDSASVRASSINTRLYGNLQATLDPALRSYASARGGSLLHPGKRIKAIADFHAEVNSYREAAVRDETVHPSVKQASAALDAYFSEYARLAKEAGLMADTGGISRYVPKMADHIAISDLAVRFGDTEMERLFRAAFLRKTPNMDPDLARRMASGYWRNIQRAGYGVLDRFDTAVHTGDKEAFREALGDTLGRTEGLTEEQANKVFDMLTGMLDNSGAAQETPSGLSRLKHRTVMDYGTRLPLKDKTGATVEVGVNDLFAKDTVSTARRYGRQMSGRIAFAQTQIRNPDTGELLMDGIRGRADLERLKDQVRGSYQQSGRPLSVTASELQNALENIDFGWKRINGIPLDGQERAYAQWVNRLKSVQFVRLMSNMGLNQIQESWKIASTLGFRAALKQLPAIRRVVTEAGRSEAARDSLLNELEHITGQGLDGLFDHYDFRWEEDRIGSFSQGVGMVMDNTLDFATKVTANVSFMRAVHGYQQRWAGKAVVQRLYDIAKQTANPDGTFDLARLGGMEKERLAAFGLGEERANRLFSELVKNAQVDGSRVIGLGSKSWEPSTLTDFTHTLTRYTDRLVQRNDFGGLAKWMSNPIATLFVQFRSFVYGGWAKASLYALHHMDVRMFALIMGELAAGVATYAVKEAPKALAENDWSKLEDPKTLLAQGIGRTATSSILPMIVDTALVFTPAPPIFGNARASGSPTDAFLGSATIGHLNDIRASTRALIESNWEDRELTQQEWNSIKRAFVPMQNNLFLSAIWAKMIEEAPQN